MYPIGHHAVSVMRLHHESFPKGRGKVNVVMSLLPKKREKEKGMCHVL